MCRLIAYKGVPIAMDQLIFAPHNSLVHQSYNAKELEEPLNGDGFGVGWYMPEIDPTPGIFVSTSPAWSNRNLRNIAPKIHSPVIFAHVRAASVGDTSESNCHPFQYQQFMCMHNGGVGGFTKLKREIRRSLSDEIYNWLRGQTDSEHFFALFLERIAKKNGKHTAKDMIKAVRDTIKHVENLKKKYKIKDSSYLNVVITDGHTVVGTRYIEAEDDEAPLSLYYSEGSRYVCENGVCRMVDANPDDHAVMIVSEKLTDLRSDWKKVPDNHMVVIHSTMKVTIEEI
jgi:ergothioneine biosynthesis protein EgtC